MALACRSEGDKFGDGRTLEGEVEHWTYHKGVADAAGLNVVMYEGGTHITTPNSMQGNAEWNGLYNDFHYSAQWGALWNDLIDMWYGVMGPSNVLNKMNDVTKQTPNQNEGLLRFIGDTNPQATAWFTQQEARNGQPGRGATDFVGAYDLQS